MVQISPGCSWTLLYVFFITVINAQNQQTVILGMGNNTNITVESSHATISGIDSQTLLQDGFLPNLNAASRFLGQATLGYNMEDIEYCAQTGVEDWIEEQVALPPALSFLDKVIEYHQYRMDSLGDPDAGPAIHMWDYAWWQYHVTSNDVLRQRIAFALSEIFVISRFSGFANQPYAFADFYDMFMDHAFGNYRDLMEAVTYHPAMGLYLTYINNPKTDTIANTYPDENYARELMQLFSLGINTLNMDGTVQVDTSGQPIPVYDNNDIAEFSKIFTGLTWGDRDVFGKNNALHDTSYVMPMQMFNEYHEPGEKHLLNNTTVIDRNPVDGNADVDDALDNIFNHNNVPPFVSTLLIKRLVTSNPSPGYVQRVAQVFADNGNGVRGDLTAVVKAILLDPVARDCASAENITFGMLREPFIRYVQVNKAFDVSTLSGNHRNAMDYVQEYVGQKPNTSPSVFNFFQQDFQPIGPVEQLDLVAPEFQITNTQSITGYINGLYRWIVKDNPADEYDLYSGEPK